MIYRKQDLRYNMKLKGGMQHYYIENASATLLWRGEGLFK